MLSPHLPFLTSLLLLYSSDRFLCCCPPWPLIDTHFCQSSVFNSYRHDGAFPSSLPSSCSTRVTMFCAAAHDKPLIDTHIASHQFSVRIAVPVPPCNTESTSSQLMFECFFKLPYCYAISTRKQNKKFKSLQCANLRRGITPAKIQPSFACSFLHERSLNFVCNGKRAYKASAYTLRYPPTF